jgi:flagellar basal-body rod protein FlgG
MSVQTLYTAATGMEALETKLEVIANNMANINTTGFKKDRANFEDLIYRINRLPGSTDADGNLTSTGIEVGLGTRVTSTQTNHTQGAMQTTGNPLDFGINATGQLVLGSAHTGWVVDPAVTIPPEAVDVVVTGDGQVQYRTTDTPTLQTAGQLNLATFINPDGLLKMGDNLYKETDASGTATESTPGEPGFGTIAQGALESSNVEPVQELIDLITTQRAFELNSQVVQAGDQIMQIAANLRRG